MILYHGSPETDLTELTTHAPDPDSKSMLMRLPAVYCSDDPWYASIYAHAGGQVYEVELVSDAVVYRIPDTDSDAVFLEHLVEALDMNAEVVVYTGTTSGAELHIEGTEFAVLNEELLQIVGRWD